MEGMSAHYYIFFVISLWAALSVFAVVRKNPLVFQGAGSLVAIQSALVVFLFGGNVSASQAELEKNSLQNINHHDRIRFVKLLNEQREGDLQILSYVNANMQSIMLLSSIALEVSHDDDTNSDEVSDQKQKVFEDFQKVESEIEALLVELKETSEEVDLALDEASDISSNLAGSRENLFSARNSIDTFVLYLIILGSLQSGFGSLLFKKEKQEV